MHIAYNQQRFQTSRRVAQSLCDSPALSLVDNDYRSLISINVGDRQIIIIFVVCTFEQPSLQYNAKGSIDLSPRGQFAP